MLIMAKTISKRNRAMVELYAKNPKLTKTQAYVATHNVGKSTKLSSLYTQAVDTFKKPEVQSELAKYNGLAEQTVVQTITKFKDSNKVQEVALATDTAKWLHDKVHGKATQRVEQHNTSVNLNLDLTTALDNNIDSDTSSTD